MIPTPTPGARFVPSSVTIVARPGNGAATVNPSTGAITFTPNQGFSGADQLTYTVSNNFGLISNVATVALQVTASPPIANNDTAFTPANTSTAINVLANDSDLNAGGTLNPRSVVIVSSPSDGSTSLNTNNGVVTYTPNANFSGEDQFYYTVSDNFGLTSNKALVTIQVSPPVYSRPAANNDFATTTGNTPVVIKVLANDTDPNQGATFNDASVTIVSAPTNGSTSLNASSGTITYTPGTGFTGTDTFQYTVSDTYGQTSLPALVTIVVTATPPVADNDTSTTTVGTPVTINVLANDTDLDGVLKPSTVAIVAGPGHGKTSINTMTGAITYTPAPGFFGVDQFSYTVSDNFNLTSNAATVTVDVTPSAPIANNDTAVTTSGMPVVIDILGNDSDPNAGGTLIPSSVLIVSRAGHGATLLDPTTGDITYTPQQGFSGKDQFTYTIDDTLDQISSVATVTVLVSTTITATGMRFNLYPGLPLDNVPIATFADANFATSIGQSLTYSASVNWGDGLTSLSAISGPTSSGAIFVYGSYTYPAILASQSVPGSALPVSITLTDSAGDTATANSSAVLVTVGQTIAFTGGLAPIPANGPAAANGSTDITMPTFSGTAPALSDCATLCIRRGLGTRNRSGGNGRCGRLLERGGRNRTTYWN